MVYTALMDKLFSDESSVEFKDAVLEAVNEAREGRDNELNNGEDHLVFQGTGDGDVIISDQNTGELTAASEGPDGTLDLENVSDDVHETEDEDGNRKFSVVWDFDTEDEARMFSERLHLGTFTFSEEEVNSVADVIDRIEDKYHKMENTGDAELADEILDDAEEVKSYSNLARSVAGYDTDEFIEKCNFFSAAAEDMIFNNLMDYSVTRYFSELSEEEAEEVLENMDDDQKEALEDIVEHEDETGDTVTFSDYLGYVDELRSPMNQDITAFFSDLIDNGEFEEFCSQFSDDELEALQPYFDASDNGYTVTFSDLNDALEEVNTRSICRLFSDDMSDEEVDDFEENATEDQKELRDAAIDEELNGGDVNFSDVTRVLFFSEEDAEEAVSNANEIVRGAEALSEDPDEDLAKEVKVLADNTLDDLSVAHAAGYDVEEQMNNMKDVSDYASNILDTTPDDDDYDDDDDDDYDEDDDDDDDDDDSVTLSHEESSVKNSITTPSGKIEFVKGIPSKVEVSDDPTIKDDEKVYSDKTFSDGGGKMNAFTFKWD